MLQVANFGFQKHTLTNVSARSENSPESPKLLGSRIFFINILLRLKGIASISLKYGCSLVIFCCRISLFCCIRITVCCSRITVCFSRISLSFRRISISFRRISIYCSRKPVCYSRILLNYGSFPDYFLPMPGYLLCILC